MTPRVQAQDVSCLRLDVSCLRLDVTDPRVAGDIHAVDVSVLSLLDTDHAVAVSFHVEDVTDHVQAVSGQRVIGDSRDVKRDRQAMDNRYLGDASSTLLIEAGRVLQLNQRQLAEALGVSRRTVVRWTARHTSITPIDMVKLARMVFPHDMQLAEALALKSATTLDRLGLFPPAPPQPPALPPPVPSPPAPSMPRLVDVVVCAAADALDLPPRAVRPGLLAALQRARELGLKLEQVEHALANEPASLKPRGPAPGDKRPARPA